MLDNTFDEEYFRLENTIDTNFTEFHTDREGKLILSHPIFKEARIQEVVERELGVNILPDNVNLIIDSVVLISNNPLCQNYLPLRIAFGSKPSIEFTDITFTQLDNYKVIVSPLLPIDTFRNHRYSNPDNYGTPNPNSGRDGNFRRVINCGNFTGGNGLEYLIQLVLYDGTGTIQPYDAVIILTEVVSRKYAILTVADFSNAVRIVNIYPNDGLCLVVCQNPIGQYSVYDITLSRVGPWIPIKTVPNLKEVYITADNDFSLLYTNYVVPTENGHVISQLNKTYDAGGNYVWTTIQQRIIKSFAGGNQEDLFAGSVFFTNRIVYLTRDQVTGRYLLRDISFQTHQLNVTTLFERDITDIIGAIPTVNTGFLTNVGIFIGGRSIQKPNISIFYWDISPIADASTLSYFYFPSYEDLELNRNVTYSLRKYPFNSLNLSSAPPQDFNYFLLKRYYNQVYFQTYLVSTQTSRIYSFCQDNGESFDYTLNELQPNNIIPRFLDCVSFSKGFFFVGGGSLSGDAPTPVVNSVVFANQRLASLSSVYKMTYNYTERTYPYRIEGNNIAFTLSLPNNTPIADIEIFKYVIDIRVRYSKTKAKINAPEPTGDNRPEDASILEMANVMACEEDCQLDEREQRECSTQCGDSRYPTQPREVCEKGDDGKMVCKIDGPTGERGKMCLEKCGKTKCQAKCNRSVGGVGRVLGYVGDDFSVVDFLNLYSTR